MKTKKNLGKQKKKKTTNVVSKSSGIRKSKKVKDVKKVKNSKKDLILETLKKDVDESSVLKKAIPNRQLVWNSYLKTFTEVEKLNKRQKQIMEFCTNKSRTPPKRKRKFLNFIRHSFPNQADVTDEQVNELFDLLLKKYDDFKSGVYSSISSKLDDNCDHVSKSKLSVNKKKKLKRAAAKALLNSANEETEDSPKNQPVKVGIRKKKRAKIAEMEVDEENHD